MKRSYLFIALSAAGVACFAPVDVIYFQSLGYSLAFIGLMAAAFNFAVTAAEIPFAIVFDRYSNKLALQLGNLLRLVAFALFFLSFNEPSLLLAQVLAGVAVAAMSGTSNALIVNQINTIDANKIAGAFGRISYIAASGGVFGGLLGVAVYAVWPQGIWVAAMAFFIGAGLLILGFQDSSATVKRIPTRDFLVRALGTARAPNAWLLILTNAAAVAPFLLWQIRFNQFSLTFLLLGYMGLNAANIVGPLLLRVLRIQVRHIAVVAALNVVAAVMFALAEGPIPVWAAFFVHVALHGALQILVSGLFHEGVPNDVRATAGSVISMADSLIVALVAPLVAIVGQSLGLQWAIGVSALLYASVLIGGMRSRQRSDVPAKAETA